MQARKEPVGVEDCFCGVVGSRLPYGVLEGDAGLTAACCMIAGLLAPSKMVFPLSLLDEENIVQKKIQTEQTHNFKYKADLDGTRSLKYLGLINKIIPFLLN